MEHSTFHINFAIQILETYEFLNKEPLHLFLKKYFTKNKKFGKRDRAIISDLIYYYFRCKFSNDSFTTQDLLQTREFLPSKTRKGTYWKNVQFSEGISFEQFASFFYKESRLFVKALRKLNTNEILALEDLGNQKFAMPLRTKLHEFWNEKYFFVQDLSSQLVAEKWMIHGKTVWETCCGAGGKSLQLALDKNKIEHYASDIRKSSLLNLSKRFKLHQLDLPKLFVHDATKMKKLTPFENVDTLICDVPCSGSGTWRRTPEMATITTINEVQRYSALQRLIVKNAVEKLHSGGILNYITCSVFKIENEDNIDYFERELGLKCLSYQLINSLPQGGDVLFLAIFEKK